MRSEYTANNLLASTRQTPNVSLMGRGPKPRTLWYYLFCWL